MFGATGGERIVYRLPRPTPGGGTALSLTPPEFLERDSLCSLLDLEHRHDHALRLRLNPNARHFFPLLQIDHRHHVAERRRDIHRLAIRREREPERIRGGWNRVLVREVGRGVDVHQVEPAVAHHDELAIGRDGDAVAGAALPG